MKIRQFIFKIEFTKMIYEPSNLVDRVRECVFLKCEYNKKMRQREMITVVEKKKREMMYVN